MYVHMYIRPSQPETPRLRNSPVLSAGVHDNKTLYLATIGHETAQHFTSSLHAAFRLLLTSPIAPARATRLLAIPPYWLTSFPAWPGTLSLFPRVNDNAHCVSTHQRSRSFLLDLCTHGRASLRSSKYVGVDGSAAIQCFRLGCYPFFLTASESSLQFYYCPKCTCPGQVMLMHCTLIY